MSFKIPPVEKIDVQLLVDELLQSNTLDYAPEDLQPIEIFVADHGKKSKKVSALGFFKASNDLIIEIVSDKEYQDLELGFGSSLPVINKKQLKYSVPLSEILHTLETLQAKMPKQSRPTRWLHVMAPGSILGIPDIFPQLDGPVWASIGLGSAIALISIHYAPSGMLLYTSLVPTNTVLLSTTFKSYDWKLIFILAKMVIFIVVLDLGAGIAALILALNILKELVDYLIEDCKSSSFGSTPAGQATIQDMEKLSKRIDELKKELEESKKQGNKEPTQEQKDKAKDVFDKTEEKVNQSGNSDAKEKFDKLKEKAKPK